MNSRQWVISTGDDRDWPIADEYSSRKHATLREHPDGAVWVKDAGSTNGTYLNGVGVLDPQAVTVGDQIKIGRTI